MKKEERLVKKIKRLLRRANLPRWLHHFGPKTYEFWQHVLALFIKQACKLSYRRVVQLLEGLGFIVPSYSALAKMNRRATQILEKLFYQTCPKGQVVVASVDATTISRTNPSWHYIKRIDREKPVSKPLKLSQVVDTRRKKILALRLRAKPRHDTQDVKYLLKRMRKPKILVADKGYDAEWIHALAHELGIITMIPSRKKVHRGFYRKKMLKLWRTQTYHRREMSESTYGGDKQKYGSYCSSRNIRTQRSDIYVRAVLHNLGEAMRLEIFNTPGNYLRF